MKYLSKPYLTLSIFSVLFLLFFSGLYSMYTVYFLPYFQSNYEWYSFPDKQAPTKIQLLFSGFQSGRLILYALAMGLVLIILAKELKTFNHFKKGTWQILSTSFSWTTLFAALYCVSEFIWYKTIANFSSSFSLGIIRAQLPYLIVLYFILIVPTVAILYKKKQ